MQGAEEGLPHTWSAGLPVLLLLEEAASSGHCAPGGCSRPQETGHDWSRCVCVVPSYVASSVCCVCCVCACVCVNT